jgi:hypothetical protein
MPFNKNNSNIEPTFWYIIAFLKHKIQKTIETKAKLKYVIRNVRLLENKFIITSARSGFRIIHRKDPKRIIIIKMLAKNINFSSTDLLYLKFMLVSL